MTAKLVLLILVSVHMCTAIYIENPDTGEEKRSIATGRGTFRPSKRDSEVVNEDQMGVETMDKRSLALGRVQFRPGKRTAATGRLNFRPGKRTMAMGRLNFRPGKRSLALGRTHFRPGKRNTVFEQREEAPMCTTDFVNTVDLHMDFLQFLLQEYVDYLSACELQGIAPTGWPKEPSVDQQK